MNHPSLCVIFNNVDDASSIGKLCAWSVRTALDAGWTVTVVARDLDQALRGDVEWLRLFVPPRAHAVQWYAAYPTVRWAIKSRRWDVVHVQQPQLAGIADVLHLHYLVRAARQARPSLGSETLRQRSGRLQTRLTEIGESRCLSHLPTDLELVPVSHFLEAEFERLYGKRSRTTVLENPAPAVVTSGSNQDRDALRADLGFSEDQFVIGFLGGADVRKGGRALLDGISSLDNVVVLYGGDGVAEHPLTGDRRKVRVCGYVRDIGPFFAVCDAFAAVSTFDPAPLAPLEALAHGVPVIGTRGVGGLDDMVREDCGVLWSGTDGLETAVNRVRVNSGRMKASALRFAADRSQGHQGGKLLRIYDQAAENGSRRD